MVTKLWQRGMPHQEAIIRVQQALVTARQRQLGEQSFEAGLGEQSALSVSRKMAHEEPGVLVSGLSGHKQISNSASGAHNFESSAIGRSEVFPSLMDSLPKSAFALSRLDRSHMQRLNVAERPGYESEALNRLDAREQDVYLEGHDRSPLRKSCKSSLAKTTGYTPLGSSRLVDIYGFQGLHKHNAREHHLQSLDVDDSRLQGRPDCFPANVGVLQKAAGCSLPKLDWLLAREQILQGLDVGDTASQVGKSCVCLCLFRCVRLKMDFTKIGDWVCGSRLL